MKAQKNSCLSCRYFRLDDLQGGVCRVVKNSPDPYPRKGLYDICDHWQDCGQQYFIRFGWLKRCKTDLEGDAAAKTEAA